MVAITKNEPKFTFELACCEMVLLREIGMKEIKQKHLALTYAMAICSSEAKSQINWRKVNDAIKKRWSASGLNRVKEMAWKIIEQNTKRK